MSKSIETIDMCVLDTVTGGFVGITHGAEAGYEVKLGLPETSVAAEGKANVGIALGSWGEYGLQAKGAIAKSLGFYSK